MKRSNERGQLSKEEYERDEEEYGEGGGADTFRKADESVLKTRKIVKASRRFSGGEGSLSSAGSSAPARGSQLPASNPFAGFSFAKTASSSSGSSSGGGNTNTMTSQVGLGGPSSSLSMGARPSENAFSADAPSFPSSLGLQNGQGSTKASLSSLADPFTPLASSSASSSSWKPPSMQGPLFSSFPHADAPNPSPWSTAAQPSSASSGLPALAPRSSVPAAGDGGGRLKGSLGSTGPPLAREEGDHGEGRRLQGEHEHRPFQAGQLEPAHPRPQSGLGQAKDPCLNGGGRQRIPHSYKTRMTQLNRGFAAWASQQIQENPFSVWVEGVRDYVKFAQAIAFKYGEGSEGPTWVAPHAAQEQPQQAGRLAPPPTSFRSAPVLPTSFDATSNAEAEGRKGAGGGEEGEDAARAQSYPPSAGAGGGEGGGEEEDAMPLLAPDKAVKQKKDPHEVFEKDPVRVYRLDKESKTWVDMGKGSLGLYRDPAAKKQWLAVRNITGKVVLSCALTPPMSFSTMEKASSVAFACKPVLDTTAAQEMMTLRIKVKDGLGELVKKMNELKDGK
ncbi:Ran binding domain protein [Nannochloropsis gaditana]|uniref:Ran binding domain protein n=1 Tax=Nannochloropsis gaditana TaxID=72520 RepID=W7THI1_9STRA|nr:Ran binding domain protein [Nannochloropsis gaditana]